MNTENLTNELKADDYAEPRCLLNMNTGLKNVPTRSVPVGRIVEKLDGLLSRNDWTAAERHLNYWLADAESCGDRKGALAIEGERMGLFRKRGREKEAMEAVDHALELIRELEMEDSLTAATTYVNIATVCKTFGHAERGLPFFEKARTVYEANLSGDDPRLGGLYNNTALALADLGRLGEARDFYEKALQVMRSVPGSELEQAVTKLNLADLEVAEKGSEEADETVQALLGEGRALLDTPQLPRNGYYAYVLTSCAPTFEYYGRFADAAELKEAAQAIYNRPEVTE